ncbi:polyprenyl synthetase family protein [Sulfitobacter sp. JB4-11]|uniref:polyprenyl synthetase family protein n=1 Tax=Sulfitobacter rhodophyticola TaxID=3238304 RepID=UPI003D813DEA
MDMSRHEGLLDRLPLDAAMARAQAAITARFREITPQPDILGQAMGHALIGGKMLRGFLAFESCRLHGVDAALSIDPALAIECMHAYSLVHDDLPCMDDDDLRRGRPTVHKQWDEATAVLAGDALQSLAFELLAHSKFGTRGQVLVKMLARLGGRHGMVRGQMQDIAAETTQSPLTLDEVTELQHNKTGKLICWSCMVGPMMIDRDSEDHPLRAYANAIGLAFQIADDILDIEGDAATVGKATHKDADAGKATFVSLMGLDEAKRRADDLVQSACDALSVYGNDAATLQEAARFIIARKS